jgi:hypothetical protein
MCSLLSACQQDMASQPSIRPDERSAFFEDGRANRPLIPGTVARGHLRTDQHLFAGTRGTDAAAVASAVMLIGSGWDVLSAWTGAGLEYERSSDTANDVDTFPFAVTREVLEHGRNRFQIFCIPCHDSLGTGDGMIVQRGFTRPPSYHIDRLRRVPVGHFFRVMTDGYGSMPSYRHQVPPRDRWAIAAYIRALQLSQHFPAKDLTGEMKEQWGKQKNDNPDGRARQ